MSPEAAVAFAVASYFGRASGLGRVSFSGKCDRSGSHTSPVLADCDISREDRSLDRPSKVSYATGRNSAANEIYRQSLRR